MTVLSLTAHLPVIDAPHDSGVKVARESPSTWNENTPRMIRIRKHARPAPSTWHLQILLLVIAGSMFAIALSGYPNLMDNERRVGAYVLDAVQNGHWLMQKDVTGAIASKPPLLTWIAASATLVTGEISRFTIYLPSALATAGVALLLLNSGKRYFGWTAGFLAAAIYLLSPAGARQLVTARYDGLLAFPVTWAALAAFRAWNTGQGWSWFWLAGAVGTMAKGPIALALGACGLLAHFWEKRTQGESTLRGAHWPGIALFLLICGGWFLLAYAEMGQPFIDKLLGRELAAHAIGAGRGESMFMGFHEPTVSFLTNFAPWNLLAGVAFWRVWKHPADDALERRFERFLFCWFFAGLLLFSIAAHQRGRLVFPLFPAAALLAGRELSWWLRFWSTPRLLRMTGAIAAVVLVVLFIGHHLLLAHSSRVQTTLGIRAVAERVRETLGAEFPIVHVDTPFALQFSLNTARPLVSFERAAALLQSNEPVVVAVSDFARLEARFSTNPPALHELARWPVQGQTVVRVVSNRPFQPASFPTERKMERPEIGSGHKPVALGSRGL
jgi:4-amino-4-deoxy-L-arabinose transferase-like glycosyltransferase